MLTKSIPNLTLQRNYLLSLFLAFSTVSTACVTGGAGVDSPSKQKKLKVEKNANLAGRIPTVRCTLCYVRFGLYDKIIC
jgi:hypothetical protein